MIHIPGAKVAITCLHVALLIVFDSIQRYSPPLTGVMPGGNGVVKPHGFCVVYPFGFMCEVSQLPILLNLGVSLSVSGRDSIIESSPSIFFIILSCFNFS